MDTAISSSVVQSNSRPAHLWKKGQSGNPAGKKKGTISLKESLKKLLTKSSAEQIINTLIDMAKSGSIQHTKLVAELTGDVLNGPQVSITQNTSLFTPDMLDSIRQAVENKRAQAQLASPVVDVVDVVALPVTASLGPIPAPPSS